LDTFIDVKGWKSQGNRLSTQKILNIKELETTTKKDKLTPGDVVDLEVKKRTGTSNGREQGKLF